MISVFFLITSELKEMLGNKSSDLGKLFSMSGAFAARKVAIEAVEAMLLHYIGDRNYHAGVRAGGKLVWEIGSWCTTALVRAMNLVLVHRLLTQAFGSSGGLSKAFVMRYVGTENAQFPDDTSSEIIEMSLFGAMNTAISGLSSQSAAFSNISDNVANSQTVGFKRVDTAFIDYLTTSNANTNISGAAVAKPEYMNNVQGTVAQTDNPLGLAIAGQGFFPVSHPAGSASGSINFSPTSYFTRTGDFQLNKSGFIVNSAGEYLNGWSVNSTTGVVNRNAVAPIQINQTVFKPVATSAVSLSANLPATPSSGSVVSSQVDVYDGLGTAHAVTLNWVRNATNDWTVSVNVADDVNAAARGSADVQFGGTSGNPVADGTVGNLSAATGSITTAPYSSNSPANLAFTADFGQGAQAITLNLGNFGQSAGLTQYAGTSYSLRGLSQDGVPPGSFSSISTSTSGDLSVNYDNGQSRVIARVPVVTFASPNSLQRQDGQSFTASIESGNPLTQDAGTNGAGSLVTGSIEQSNVDVAQEFSKLIVAQRAYSANTKLVTTADQLLQETIDMKRFLMSLDGALQAAAGGLANVSRQIAVISNNIANANTPDYAREVGTQISLTAGGQGMGVLSGSVVREIDLQLQSEVFQQNASVASAQTRQVALQGIDAIHGTPGQGTDLSSMLGKVSDAFTALQSDPSNTAGQYQVLNASVSLATKINTISGGYLVARQNAQDGLQAGIAALNRSISNVADITDKIIRIRAEGRGSADLESQRDTDLRSMSNLLGVKFIAQPDGSLLAATFGGIAITLRSPPSQFSVAPSSISAQSYYPNGGIMPIMLNGADVTRQIVGGQLGAELELRDKTLPTYQGELDEFSNTLSQRFSAQGLALFNTPAGAISPTTPPSAQSGYIGYSSLIAVAPAVISNPNAVRDGNVTVVGSSVGPSAFTPNPLNGPAAFGGLIARILTYSFGSEVQTGIAQPSVNVSDMGPLGTFSGSFIAPRTLSEFSTSVVSSQALDASNSKAQLDTEAAVQASLNTRVAASSGVSTDAELSKMVGLQNAYGANARVIAASQSMWTQLLSAIT
eukprot:gene9699-9763_t